MIGMMLEVIIVVAGGCLLHLGVREYLRRRKDRQRTGRRPDGDRWFV